MAHAHHVDRDGLSLSLLEGFVDWPTAQRWFEALRDSVPWERPRVRVYGRWHDLPRLTAWVADAGIAYRYSGVEHAPLPWTALLQHIRERVEAAAGARFNAVLLNCYRTGQDTVGWHSDGEAELGPAPTIASLSLGGTRRFRLRPRPQARRRGRRGGTVAPDAARADAVPADAPGSDRADAPRSGTGDAKEEAVGGDAAPAPCELELRSGSLLIMRGSTQRCWQHCVPRCRAASPRINLTFRLVRRAASRAGAGG